MPKEWKESFIATIYKKGDERECSNYRGIPLSSTTYAILSNVLLSRLTPCAEEITEDHPRGFRRNRPTNDHVWCGFDRASSLICGNKMPTRCNRGFYWRSYCLLNMLRAPLCPSSGAQEYYTVVAACGISCCGFQVAGLVWSWGLCVRNTTGSNHCIILLSSWWWA